MISGFQKTSLVDYPEKIATTIFISGCNFRCPYCHNKDLIVANNKDNFLIEDLFSHLESKRKFLDGVCITGGEPTLFKGIFDLIEKIKSKGFLVKLDTNGTNPNIIKSLLDSQLIDFIAMDIKGPFEKYNAYTVLKTDINKIKESIDLIKKSNIAYEFRSTVLPRLHTFEDILITAKQLGKCDSFAIQQFRKGSTLDPDYENEKSFSKSELEMIKKEINELKIFSKVILRAN